MLTKKSAKKTVLRACQSQWRFFEGIWNGFLDFGNRRIKDVSKLFQCFNMPFQKMPVKKVEKK